MGKKRQWVMLGVIAVIVGHLAVGEILRQLGLHGLALAGISEVISLGLLALLVGRDWREALKVSPQHLGRGIAMLWPILFVGLGNLLAAIQVDTAITQRLLAVVVALMVAVFEEGLFRGVIFGGLRKANWMGHLWGQMTASAAIFGSLHLVNLLNGQSLLATVMQVIYAFALGMLFAAIVVRTGSLLSGMLGHGLIDALGLQSGVVSIGSPDATTVGVYLGMSMILLAWALFITRPAKRVA